MGTGGKGFLSYAATVILQSVRSGYLYGFDIIVADEKKAVDGVVIALIGQQYT